MERMTDVLKRKFRQKSYVRIAWIYYHQIMKGYRIYSKILKKYGEDITIFSCALHGSGDIFFVSRYLNAFMQREKISSGLFLLGGTAELSVTKLFPEVFKKVKCMIINEEDIYNLMRFRLFAGCKNVNIIHFHHCSYTPQLTVTDMMEGYHGLTMTDLYLHTTLNMKYDMVPDKPAFAEDQTSVTKFFENNDLQPGRTVVLAPYSVSGGRLPETFWERLAACLLNNGYSVCTNSSDPQREPVITGTTRIFFTFVQSKSYLEYAGYFIGYRSGLCDIIGGLNCKKIVIYASKDMSEGFLMSYVGLSNMGLSNDVIEFEYRCGLLKKILSVFDIKESSYLKNTGTILYPAFRSNNIAVASAVSEEYFPYICVTIQSIIDTSSSNNNYDIIILGEHISAGNKEVVRDLIKGHSNFSVRYIEISEFLSQYDLPVEEQYKPVIYARLTLPEIMQKYEKVVYIDSDVVLTTDIAKLYATDVRGYLLAAVRDAVMIAWYHTPGNPEYEYIHDVLKLRHPDQYFNSGVIVFNIPEFGRQFSTEFLFEYATSRFWKWRDQDVFMTLTDGKVKLLGQEWNVLVPYFRDELQILEDGGQYELKKRYIEAVNHPNLIHYIGCSFLSLNPKPLKLEIFWKYALKTPVFDELLQRALAKTCQNNIVADSGMIAEYQFRDLVLNQYKDGKIGFRYILKYTKAWLGYKLCK